MKQNIEHYKVPQMQGCANGIHPNLARAFVLERKIIRFILTSVSPEQFLQLTGRKRFGKMQNTSVTELMHIDIESKVCELSVDDTIRLWEYMTKRGVMPAIKSMYSHGLHKALSGVI